MLGRRRPAVASALFGVLAVAVAQSPANYKSVSDASNKKIGMVIATLKDILQSAINEEKQESDMFKQYMTWCDKEKKTIAKNQEETRTELQNAKVQSEEQVSSIDSLTLFVSKTEKEIEETKDAIAQAVALRQSENDKYTEEMQLNTQSLRQINLAIQHVGKVQKQGGFLQNGVLKKLAVNAPGESSYVLGVMKGLKDKLTKTRNQLEKVEKEKVQMHNEFMDTKGKSLKSLTDGNAAKKITLAETTAKEAGTKRKIGKLTEEVDTLAKNAMETNEVCQKTAHEWEIRQADRTKEKAALNQAIKFLVESSKEQRKVVKLIQEDAQAEQDAPSDVVFAPSLLQVKSDSASEFYKAANAALSGEDEDNVDSHMKKNTFDGVKGVVKKLIQSHQDTQEEEKSKRDYCEKSISDMEEDKATSEDDLDAVKADIDKKTSEVETLADEVKNLYKSIDEMKSSLEEAGKLRKKEKALFEASSKDRALALKVLNQAKAVLQDFYEKEALIQQPNPPQMPKSSRKSAASFGAVSMVQDIADDIAKEQKDAAMAEEEAAVAYENLQKETQAKTDDTHASITDRVTTKAKLGVQINTLKETRQQHQDDISSMTKQLKALHESCDELLKNYDSRKKGRAFEVSQLRDVVDILSGSSIAARVGLAQEDSSPDAEGDADSDA